MVMAIKYVSKQTGEEIEASNTQPVEVSGVGGKGMTLSEKLMQLQDNSKAAAVALSGGGPDDDPVQPEATQLKAENLTVVNYPNDGGAVLTAQKTGEEPQVATMTIPTVSADSIADCDLAKVSVNLGQTVSMGDYQSLKIGVHITMPSSVGDIDSTFAFAKQWAEDRVSELVTEALGAKKEAESVG
jgi:hypothetical protein